VIGNLPTELAMGWWVVTYTGKDVGMSTMTEVMFCCTLAIGVTACAVDLEDDAEEPELATAESATTTSYTASCAGPFETMGLAGGGITFANARGGCRRINGTWTGYVSWGSWGGTYSCYSDITNCNGVLRCGGC
jgi:hypothetical protein